MSQNSQKIMRTRSYQTNRSKNESESHFLVMPVLIASDAHGQMVKKSTADLLTHNGFDVFDMGVVDETNSHIVGSLIHNNPAWTAVIFCKNPNCLSMTLNNDHTNVRSVVATSNTQDLTQAKRNHKANILCVSSTIIAPIQCVGSLVNDFVLV